ncbi:Hypothetical predicted protein [Mytilus galloprovincialis]|uniref:Uncharacterized protein n=1 Tax=Mytilus galloprovincialis TaxID=29158 RepID=A0A8B6BEE9_MYTGA|nr:Hypothetical predicted protein [Mytilus galloprovincialis]
MISSQVHSHIDLVSQIHKLITTGRTDPSLRFIHLQGGRQRQYLNRIERTVQMKMVPLDKELPPLYEVSVPQKWMVTLLSKCKGKGSSFTIKTMLDGFFLASGACWAEGQQSTEQQNISSYTS